MMQWEHLFTPYRIGQAAQAEPSVRSEYQRDCDRILFSAAFRRLQDKTQVFPLEKNDYVRTRLTHSLEVSCVGRSLGSSVGEYLLAKYPTLVNMGLHRADVGDIVAAACLAHDIGNPPFGHSGEQAMRDYFTSNHGADILNALAISDEERADLDHIEGNAQGFRICNYLESPDNKGGLRLTATTLASAAKYPTTAYVRTQTPYKKNGIYQADLEDYAEVFTTLDIPQIAPQAWLRHPLSFLMEAADDICYLIVDIEDVYQIGQTPFKTAKDLFVALAGDLVDNARLDAMRSRSDQLAYLRAKAVGRLVFETVEVFKSVEEDLINGRHSAPLLLSIPSYQRLEALRDYAEEFVYLSRPVMEIQVAGHRVLTGLLDIFCSAVASGANGNRYEMMLLKLLPSRYRRHAETPYQQLLAVCDYISGMTDSYAVSLYKKLTGISLPAE